MKIKIDKALRRVRQYGGFGIQILYPGIIRPQLKESGFATISRIDLAKITPGTSGIRIETMKYLPICAVEK